MKKILLTYLMSASALIPLSTLANTIDSGGTWGVLLPDGTTISGLHYENDPDILNADTFFSAGGNGGTLTVNVDQDTDINITQGFVDGQVNVSGFNTGTLNVESGIGRRIELNGTDFAALEVSGGAAATVNVNEGSYDGWRTWSGTGQDDRNGGSFTGIGTLNLTRTTFLGAFGWNRTSIGDHGLVLTSIGVATIDNFANDEANAIYGGSATEQGDASDITSHGGNGLVLAGTTTLFATNLYTRGGDGAGGGWSGTTRTGSRTATANGGDGYTGATTAKSTVQSGIIQGGDGAARTFNFEDSFDYGNVSFTSTANGGIGLNGANNSEFKDITFLGGTGGSLEGSSETDESVTLTASGGNATAGALTGTEILNSIAVGGTGGEVTLSEAVGSLSATLNAGHGIASSGSAVVIDDVESYGGVGGVATAAGVLSSMTIGASGGAAGNGVLNITDSTFLGGDGGEIFVTSNTTGSATANAGAGVNLTGTSVINSGRFTGGQGGSVDIEAGTASANGGHGVQVSSGTATIISGNFKGGTGGQASSTTASSANGGNGIYVSGGEAIINGGRFIAGRRGSAMDASNGHGLAALNGSVTLDGEDALIRDGFLFEVTAGSRNLNLLQGTVKDGIEINLGAAATTVLTASDTMKIGPLKQTGGQVNVALSSTENARRFNDIVIKDGAWNFANHMAEITGDYRLASSTSALEFSLGGELRNATVKAGLGTVESNGDLELSNNSTLQLNFDTVFDANGVSSISGGQVQMTSGNLVLNSSSSKLVANGVAAVYTDTLTLTTGGVDANAPLEERVSVDLGWLVDTTLREDSGIKVDLAYKPLRDTELKKGIDTDVLDSVDVRYMAASEADFYSENKAGAGALRYSLSQLPQISETAFKVSHEVNKQIAARGTEYRSMNGYASSKPAYNNRPQGVAGPDSGDDRTLQGWIRGYSANVDADSDGDFDSYDSGTWGTVIGIDKSFGNILVGVAGGYARTDLDGSYEADIDTYHGTIYSTVGGERIFVDLALTYGESSSEETGTNNETDFDSQMLSFYIGAGMSFDLTERISITPEASLLSTYYEQDGFTRNGVWGTGVAKEYDTMSYIGSLGANLSLTHQLDWFNRSIAFIPEVRLHWLHEFEDNPDKFKYNVNGVGYSTFAVRPREDDLARIGVGFDMWSWKAQNTKFEIDYDGLFSDKYHEHIFSGKITARF